MRRGGAARLLGVLGVALALRLLAQSEFAAAPHTFAPLIDSEAYLLQALRVAAGADLSEDVYFQAPLYPWLLGTALRLAGVPGSTVAERSSEVPRAVLERALAIGRALNVLLGLVLVALLYQVGTRLFSPGTGLAAALLGAAYGPFLFDEGHLLKGSLSLLFLPWATLAWARAERLGRPGGHLWTGLALGTGGLVRGNLHLLEGLAALVLFAVAARRGQVRKGLLAAAALVLGAGLAVLPVVVRNSLVAGRPVLATAAGGTAFYLCNYAGNNTGLVEHVPNNRQVPRHELDDWRRLTESALGREVTATEISRHWAGRAWEDIAADPLRWLRLEGRKVLLLFSRYEAPDNTFLALGEEDSRVLAATPARYGVVLPLALAGALLAWLRRRAEPAPPGRLGLATLLLGYAGTLLLFVVTERLRVPMVPLLLVYAGSLLSNLGSLLRGGWGPRLGVGFLLLAGLAASRAAESRWGPLDEAERASHLVIRLKNRALLALEAGDADAARADLRRAVALGAALDKASPDVFVVAGALDRAQALAAAAAGRAEESQQLRSAAILTIQRALEVRPANPDANRLAGLLLYDEGAYADAVDRFRRALASLPGERESRQYLTLSLLSLGRVDEALEEAQRLTDDRPGDDDGWGLLALARLRGEDTAGARTALLEYDRRATEREAAGLPRRLPEPAELAALRGRP